MTVLNYFIFTSDVVLFNSGHYVVTVGRRRACVLKNEHFYQIGITKFKF